MVIANKNRVALITGASSGIGREFARVLARYHHHLVLVARRERALNALARELEESDGVRCHPIAIDLGAGAAVQKVMEELAERRLVADVLVNNAGFAVAGEFAKSDAARQEDLMAVNVVTPTLLARSVLGPMLSRGYGRILNVSSMGAFLPGPTLATYFASKAYLLSLSRALSEELRGTGVTCTALVLGPTRSEFAAVAGLEGCRAFGSHVMSAREVAEAGFAALMDGKAVVTVGLRNKLRMLPVRLLPDRVLARFVKAYHAPAPVEAPVVVEGRAASEVPS